MPRISITARNAAAVGLYSHGVDSNGFVFLSGQTPLDAATGTLAEGSIEAQTRQCFANLGAVLEAAGLSFADVVKCNIFLTDMNDFAAMNAVYGEYFAQPFPARTMIGVASLPLGAHIEIEMIAAKR
jgi:2-iminobutanoate/2-iminopropanoate deaminase